MNKKLLVIAGGAVALVVLLLVVLAFSLGSLIRKGVESLGPEATGAPVSLGSCTLNPLTGTLVLGRFSLGNPPGFTPGDAFSLRKARVSVETGSLFSDRVVVKSVLVEGAEVTWEGVGGDNFKRIAANAQAFADKLGAGRRGPGDQGAARDRQKKIIIDDIVLRDARLHLFLGGKPAGTLPLPEVRLTGIGRDSGGAGVGEAVKKVLAGIGASATSAVAKGGADAIAPRIKGLDAVKELDAVKGLFR